MADEKLKQSLDSLQRLLKDEQLEKNWKPTWKDIKDFQAPDRGKFLVSDNDTTEYNQGSNNSRRYMIDDTPEKAGNRLGSGFMSFLTPKTSPWARLNLDDQELSNYKPVRIWLDTVMEFMFRLMGSRGTNFYPTLNNTYLEVGYFGTSAMMIEEDDESIIHCRSYTIGEFAIADNDKGIIDTFVRQDWWTVKRLVERFGLDRCSTNVQGMWKSKQFTKPVNTYHAIVPNNGLVPIESDFEWIEIYWEHGAKDVLYVSGYKEFPVMIPRWNTIASNVYGSECPGMRALGSAQSLQAIKEDWLVAFAKEVNPPLVGDVNVDTINTMPNGVSHVTGTTGAQASLVPLLARSPNLQAAQIALEAEQRNIKDTYFNDLFLAFTDMEGDRRTATEITAKQEEKFAMLGPVLNSLDEDLLSPIIERIFNILERQGFFDMETGMFPIPEELAGSAIDIEYTSVLAQAAKSIGNNNLDLWLQRVAQLAELDETALLKVDTFAVIDHLHATQGINGKLLVSNKEANEILAQQQAQQQQQELMQQGMAMADGAAKLGKVNVGDQNALEATLNAAGVEVAQ